MKLFSNKKKKEEEKTSSKIKKAKDIIKKEKQKIKLEKRKLKEEKLKRFSSSKLGHLLKKIFLIDANKPRTLKEQILSIVYFELMGAIMCLILLFAISGGQKLYKIIC